MEVLNKLVRHSEYLFFNYILIFGLLGESLFVVNNNEYSRFIFMLAILLSELYFLKQKQKKSELLFQHEEWLYTYFMALSLASFGIVYMTVSNGYIQASLLFFIMLICITYKFKIIQKNRKKEIKK